GRGAGRRVAPADDDADLLPGLAQRGAGAAHEARRQFVAAGLDAPRLIVVAVDCAAGKDPDAGHELDMPRPPPGEELEALPGAAQQDQRRGVARANDGRLGADDARGVVHASFPDSATAADHGDMTSLTP